MPPKVSINQQLNRVLKALDKADKDTRDALRSAAYLEYVDIMRVSLREVPVDTGRLRASAFVTFPKYTGEIKIFAGYSTDYAIYVHEDEFATHKPPTKDHFLTDPMEQALPGIADRIAKRAKALLKSGNTRLSGSLFDSSPSNIEGAISVGTKFTKSGK
jgi:hypothetical protein